MPLVRKVTLTYVQRIQLAPYNHVDAGLVVEVEPDPEAGPDAIRDLAGLITATWGTVSTATTRQVRTAVEEFDLLQDDRRRRQLAEPARNGDGAGFTPTSDSQETLAASGRQRELLASLRESLGWSITDLDMFATSLGVDMARLTRGEAQALLQALHQQPPKRRPPLPEPAPPESDPPFPIAADPEPEQPEQVEPPEAETAGDGREPPAAATPVQGPPQTPAEAERRFYTRYGAAIGGTAFPKVREFLGEPGYPKPATVEAWVALAEAVRAKAKASAAK